MFAHSVFEARRMTSAGMILVNGKTVKRPGLQLNDGDLLQIKPKKANIAYVKSHHPMIRLWSFIPRYLEVNFPSLSVVFLQSPNFEEIPNPYPEYMIRNTSAFYSKRC
jgi:ribosomal protein S4